MPNIYGPHIKVVRVEKGIKAAYVARRLKISSPTYSEIESGKRGLSAERLEAILVEIGLPMRELRALVKGQNRPTKAPECNTSREGK